MSKEPVKKERVDWKKQANSLAIQLDKTTKALTKANENKEVNEHDLIKITAQRDDFKKTIEQFANRIQETEVKLEGAGFLMKAQRDIVKETNILMNALTKITNIASDMIEFISYSEEIINLKEENK